VLTTAPPSPLHRLFRGIDLPARVSIELSEAPVWTSLALAIAGVGSAGLALAAVSALSLARGGPLRLDAMSAAAEALALVAPGAIVLATFARVAVRPRVLVQALALGLATAGLVACALVPFAAYLTLLDRDAAAVRHLVPGLAAVSLLATASVPLRVLRSLDPGVRANHASLFVPVLLLALFKLRLGA
jgi:hypothetical protein